MLKKVILIGAVMLPCIAVAEINDVATVKWVEPVSALKKQCINYSQNAPQERGYAGPIIGGLAGALLGNTVGGGNGNKAAIAVGAVGGAMVGEHVQNNQPAQQNTQRCEDVYVNVGYDVTYSYNGHTDKVRMKTMPSGTIRVKITPAE